MQRTNGLLMPVLALCVLSMLLASCAAPSPALTVVAPLRMPALPPSLAKPVSPESYSERALASTRNWQGRLMASEPK